MIGYNISRRFTLLDRKTGLDGISFHSLRHTVATMLLKSGMPIFDVSAWVGHAEEATTVNIYSHAMPSEKKRVSIIIDSIVHGKGVEEGSKNI